MRPAVPCPKVLVIKSFVLYYCAMSNVSIAEIFSSIQGEGPWVGQRQIFVRLIGCDIACRYCDTRQHDVSDSTVQLSFSSFAREHLSSSLSAEQLTVLCRRLVVPGPSRPCISLTGGEPLLQSAFLREWLSGLGQSFQIYLETNGIHDGAMAEVSEFVDVVSMDFKLPSATGLKPFWKEHERFLSASAGSRALFGKAVVTSDTTEEDLLQAATLLADFDRERTFVIQPASGVLAPAADQLMNFQNAALDRLSDVRVIPQLHPLLNVP